MKTILSNLLLCVCNLLISCSAVQDPKEPESSTTPPLWANAIDSEIKALGSFNWIVIADSSFPALSTKGSHILVTTTDIPSALDYTIQSIESSGHVKPRVYATRESQELSNSYAPGIHEHRSATITALAGREPIYLPEGTINRLLTVAGKEYRILVIKTETTLPYCSIYLELESGYWDSESETALRNQMKKQS